MMIIQVFGEGRVRVNAEVQSSNVTFLFYFTVLKEKQKVKEENMSIKLL